MRLLRTAAAVLALAGTAVTGTAGTAWAADGRTGASAAVCSTGWGSGLKSAGHSQAEPLKNIRTGAHECYDRMVFDVTGTTEELGYHVGYVDVFHQDGSGKPIPVKGGAILQIHVTAPSYDPETGEAVYAARAGQPLPGVDLTGYRTFRDTRFGASFEGQTQVGLGVRARLPFRVFQTGDRLVVDVAHTW
ncbi:hypothetical protein CUT44_02055 [Streptomyces carminius]|uniref:AMIN-like domain-containing protein n=1 Tax=Streptomyces carminius TaxID=2665496 RepID=A0A2M8MCF4_9ACTN|nr:hypothetical protein [Streptomyces carminius]PJE98047.1 hypothetical protein CUT44_10315 [Streptomyces carminius]PJF01873.1 hypothetical protein CUT44_02055 [Streptomyces carminius]